MLESLFNRFEDHIRTYDLFSDEEISTIRSLGVPRVIKKRQYLLRQGNVCRYHTFVCSGCLRSYRIDDYGGEHILGLSPSRHWVSDRTNLVTGTYSNEFIDALEDSAVIQFSTHSFKVLSEDIPNFDKLTSKIITEAFDLNRQRLYMMLSLQAEERYREFIRTFPQLHESLPIYMIASYLGISRETLTRIRRNMVW